MGVFMKGGTVALNPGAKGGNTNLGGATSNKRTTVLLGDSLINVQDLTANRMPMNSWWNACQIVMGQKLQVLNYAGVGGDTMAEIAARFDPQVRPYNPGYVVVVGGGNSIVSAVSAADTFASWKQVVNKALGMGTIPIVMPASPSSSINTQAEIDVYRDYNWQIMNYCQNNSGIIYIDPWSKFMDDSLAYPGFDTTYSDDGVHLNGVGAMSVGKEAAKQLEPHLPEYNPFVFSSVEQPGVQNPIMLGTGGTSAIGAAPDDWSASKSAGLTGTSAKVVRKPAGTSDGATSGATMEDTVNAHFTANLVGKTAYNLTTDIQTQVISVTDSDTLVTSDAIWTSGDLYEIGDDDAPGEWAQLTVTNSSAQTEFIRYVQTSAMTLADAGLAVGDVVQGFVEYEYDVNPVQLRSIEGNMRIAGAVNVDQSFSFTPTADPPFSTNGVSGIMATVPIAIHAGATGVSFTGILTYSDAAGQSSVVRFGRTAIRKLSVAAPNIDQP